MRELCENIKFEYWFYHKICRYGIIHSGIIAGIACMKWTFKKFQKNKKGASKNDG